MDRAVSLGAASGNLTKPEGDADQAVEAGQDFTDSPTCMYFGGRFSSTQRSTSRVMVPTQPELMLDSECSARSSRQLCLPLQVREGRQSLTVPRLRQTAGSAAGD
jgi:hypothetical protein